MAAAGFGSRRACDRLIFEGIVQFNGEICTNPAVYVGEEDRVKCQGKLAEIKCTKVFAFYKPAGLICSHQDEKDRTTIYDLLPSFMRRMNYVGRLDAASEGLLVLTNDGELNQRITQPSSKVEKEYIVTLDQSIDQGRIDNLSRGIYTEEGKLAAKSVERSGNRKLKIILDQGKKRHIRRMVETLGFRVKRLVRCRIGELTLGNLTLGQWKELTEIEVKQLSSQPKSR